MWKDFKDFALRGNVVDLAIGIIIGSAFTTIVKSLVDDVIMPPIGLLLGNVNFADLYLVIKAGETPGPYGPLANAQAAGAVTINYGVFINNLIAFLIVAIVTFLIVRGMNRLYMASQSSEEQPEAAPTTKSCDYCKETIPVEAIRCPYCTSHLEVAAAD
jgi:large conductance mechanosensitive channel